MVDTEERARAGASSKKRKSSYELRDLQLEPGRPDNVVSLSFSVGDGKKENDFNSGIRTLEKRGN